MFWLVLSALVFIAAIWLLIKAILEYISYKNSHVKEPLNFTTQITEDWGHTTFFLNNFSFDYFFDAEAILRKKAKFEIRWLFLSNLTAAFEYQNDLELIFRKFRYKGSSLMLFYHFHDLYILPEAKERASIIENEHVIEISNLLVQELRMMPK